MPHKDPEVLKAYHIEYRQRPAVKQRERSPERIAYFQRYNRSWLARLKVREKHRLAQVTVLMHYSNPTGTPICNNCGEQETEVLCIDHINGGGNKHEKVRRSPLNRWLINNNYPDGFQVLCANCNTRKSKLEYCVNGN